MSTSLTPGGVDVGIGATCFERLCMIHHPAGQLYADERVGRDPLEAIQRSLVCLLYRKGDGAVNG